ncbi:MAG: pantoate--beta-alanine ligase [Hyphomicrobiales bacterium]
MTNAQAMPKITRTDSDIRAEVSRWRGAGEKVALVPTMGALHEGHLSLIDYARTFASRIVVSIFVNPTQFGEGEDFETYPRTWDEDIAMLTERGVDAVYAPTAKTMYTTGFATKIIVEGPALELETDHRPHFFSGVATVVSKLLLGVLPDVAVFGEKDYQQLLVIKQMVQDLQIPCQIEGAPTVREADGLAMSSRNAYLTEEERSIAAKLHAVLQDCAKNIRNGDAPDTACKQAIAELTKLSFKVDYLTLRNADTLAALETIEDQKLRLLVAAQLGKPRLIDNIAVNY